MERKFPTEIFGAVAQLGEHLLCKQGVARSIRVSSTSFALGETEPTSSGTIEH